jgi:hypothetical protein
MTNQLGNLMDEMGAFAKRNWKLTLALGAVVVLGGILANKDIVGFSFGDGKVSFTREEPLPKNLNISGEWVYETKSQDKYLGLVNNQCSTVIGTADIVQLSDSNIVDIQGWRKACVGQNSKVTPQDISWSSDIAVIVPKHSKVFFWLKTTDNPARYGYVRALVTESKDGNGRSQPMIKGTMYYLNEVDNTWVVAQIFLYRNGTTKAIQIREKYSF